MISLRPLAINACVALSLTLLASQAYGQLQQPVTPDDPATVIPDAITRTYRLMVGTGSYPFRLVVGQHGKKVETACGPLEAAYCPTDQTIAISADFALAATTQSVNAIPFIVAHEVGHALLISAGNQPRSGVLHELMADCMAGVLVNATFPSLTHAGSGYAAQGAAFVHGLGDGNWALNDHHGFGAQRYIAFRLGVNARPSSQTGASSMSGFNDCQAIFGQSGQPVPAVPRDHGEIRPTRPPVTAGGAVCQILTYRGVDVSARCHGDVGITPDDAAVGIRLTGAGTPVLAFLGPPSQPLYLGAPWPQLPQLLHPDRVVADFGLGSETVPTLPGRSACVVAATLAHRQVSVRCFATHLDGTTSEALVFVPMLLQEVGK